MSIINKFKKVDSETQIKNELDNCNTLNEMFAVMNKYYNLDQPISKMLKPIATKTINDKINVITKFLNIKKR